MTQELAPLAIGQRVSFSPVPGVVVRLQRTDRTFVVTVERTLLVDELHHAHATEAEARRYARGICLALRAGWSIDRMIEVTSMGGAR